MTDVGEDIAYIIDLTDKMRKLERTAEFIKEKFLDNLDQLKAIADKLDRMGDDLIEAGVPGYGLSLKNEAKKLRVITGEYQ